MCFAVIWGILILHRLSTNLLSSTLSCEEFQWKLEAANTR